MQERPSSPLLYFGNRGPIDREGFQSQQTDDIYVLLSHFKAIHGKRSICYDLFSGAASLGIVAMVVDIAEEYVINDAFPGFLTLWQAIKENPEKLLEHYQIFVTDLLNSEDRSSYYLTQQTNCNNLLDQTSEKTLQPRLAALLCFIINYAQYGMLQFETNDKGTHLKCVYGTENINNVQLFETSIMNLHNLFQKRKVSFHAQKANHFIDQITNNDFVFLDPPYPEAHDAKEAPDQYLYYRPETKSELQNELIKIMNGFKNLHVPYFMFYSLCGTTDEKNMCEQPAISHHNSMWLRFSGGEKNPYGHYTEFCYTSEHFETLMHCLPKQRFERWNRLDPNLVKQPYGEVANALQKRVTENQQAFAEERSAFIYIVYLLICKMPELQTLSCDLWFQVFSYSHNEKLGKSIHEVKSIVSYFFKEKEVIAENIKNGNGLKIQETIDPEEGIVFSILSQRT